MKADTTTGKNDMRHAILIGFLLLLSGCALFEPSSRRYVVFFQSSDSDLDAPAGQVVQAAAADALAHPDRPVVVSGYADPNGTTEANDSVSSLRSKTVTAALVADGVPPSRIARKSFGAVSYTLDSQEGRRVEINVGTP